MWWPPQSIARRSRESTRSFFLWHAEALTQINLSLLDSATQPLADSGLTNGLTCGLPPSRLQADAGGTPAAGATGVASARRTKASTNVSAMRLNIGPAAWVMNALSNS